MGAHQPPRCGALDQHHGRRNGTLTSLLLVVLISLAAFLLGRSGTPWGSCAAAERLRARLTLTVETQEQLVQQLQSAEQPTTPVAQPKCPVVDSSEVPPECTLLRQVCFDEGGLVLHDPLYSVNGTLRDNLTDFHPGRVYHFPWAADANPDSLLPCGRILKEHGPLHIRPASSLEPTPDLRRPIFGCTVPFVFYIEYLYNYSHTFGQAASWLHWLLRLMKPSWASRVQVVVPTPAGMGMKPFTPHLMQPLSSGPVVTLAELSGRHAAGVQAQGRCFSSALVCRGPPYPWSFRVYKAGQFYVDHYRGSVPAPQLQFRTASAGLFGWLRRAGRGADARDGSTEAAGSGLAAQRVLKVVFQTRAGDTRQILNQEALLGACSRWSYYSNRKRMRYTAACAQWQFDDVLTSVAVAQQADVLVGVHGANVANAWFMRPRASLVEVLFMGWAQKIHWAYNRQDPASQLFYWGLFVEDGLQEVRPGPYEAAGVGCEHSHKRDKNLVLPWRALAPVLEAVADVGGDEAEYRRRLAGPERRVFFRMGNDGTQPFNATWFD